MILGMVEVRKTCQQNQLFAELGTAGFLGIGVGLYYLRWQSDLVPYQTKSFGTEFMDPDGH
jgi:hypothetical protein